MERINNIQESLEAIHPRAVVISSFDDARRCGLSTNDIQNMCQQISSSIDSHNATHPGEMLPKSPETIFSQFQSGHDLMIAAHQENDGWTFLYNGAVYPVFEDNEEYVLGYQICEFGTSITNEKFRGQHIGTIGAIARMNLLAAYERSGVTVIGIATVKQAVTLHVLEKAHFHEVSYFQVPYTASLTCSCSAVSEHFHIHPCKYRRPHNSSYAADIALAAGERLLGIPCTLLTTDKEGLEQFEARCRELHGKYIDSVYRTLETDTISNEGFANARDFFARVAREQK